MKSKIVLSAFSAATVAVLLLSGCATGLPTVKKNFKKRYEITLPDDTRLEYVARTSTGLRGESAEYYVLTFEQTPEFISSFKSKNLSDGENAEDYINGLTGYFSSTIDIINGVSKDHLPDFTAVYEWNYGESLNGLCAIYYPDANRMYACYSAITNK